MVFREEKDICVIEIKEVKMIPIIGDIIQAVASIGGKVIDKVAGDKINEKDKAELQNNLAIELLKADWSTVQKQFDVIIAESQGNWLQKSWRPILMLSIVAIVVNNYIIFPYISIFGMKAVLLELPEKLWNLLTIGVGGYVIGRSAEKVAENWKK